MLDRFARSLVACLLMSMISAAAWAQASLSEPSASIALSTAMMRTLARNPALVAHGFDIPAAEGRLLQTEFAPMPELN